MEILRNISDPPFTHCPKCGGEVKKLFSAPAIQFKGTGWYKTDYASKPAAAKSETKSESSSSNSETSTKSETKTETKSEAKSETKSESKSD
jgi:putative FmdB family regulatory protein